MQADLTGPGPRLEHPPFLNLRWSAVLAGLAVGACTNLVLLLIGAAAGLAAFNAGAEAQEDRMLLAISIWDTVCMLVAAFLGGYIAARASGMRRTADGIMHGVLAWSAAMLTVVLLATSAAGGALAGMLNGFTAESASEMRPLTGAEREAIVQDLQDRFGLSHDQASAIADEISTMAGAVPGGASPRQALRTATVVGGWISAAVLLSLAGAIGGGVLGSRSTRRSARPPGGKRRDVTPRGTVIEPPPYEA